MFIAVKPFMNSTHTKPYLECPECGEVVLSMEERAHTTIEMVYTCPHCKCRYRIPFWCQMLQRAVATVTALILLIIYGFFIRSPGSSWNIIDLTVIILLAVPYVFLIGIVGRKLSYIAPLEKV